MVMAASAKSNLPARYRERWRDPFDARVMAALRPGVAILDVGSGRRPALEPEQRPPGCQYVGLDISEAELKRAPAGSYDEMWVSDVTRRVSELEQRFDLIVSWQVLEHVKPLDQAMDNLRAYLRPGGRLVAQFSGKFSIFGVINSVVPQRLGVWAMEKLLRREPDTVFPAYYHRCWYGAIDRILALWTEHEIMPRFVGAGYFSFSRTLQRLYLVYEAWLCRGRHQNLASHYVVTAVR